MPSISMEVVSHCWGFAPAHTPFRPLPSHFLFFALTVFLAGQQAAGAESQASAGKKASFSVNTQLVSGWPQTPSAAQSLEWLRDVDAAEAKSFLWQLVAGGIGKDVMSPVAQGLLRSGSAKTFHELLVRNAYYSPRIEMLRSLERVDRRVHGQACKDVAAWALVWNSESEAPTAACNASAFSSALALGATNPNMPSDFQSSRLDLIVRDGRPGAVAVVYGALNSDGLPSLALLLNEVQSLKATSDWRVVFRHADGPHVSDGVGADMLTGYGFELAIKSSEYKTHADESEKKTDEESETAEAEDADDATESTEQQKDVKTLDAPLEIDGLLFHVLLKRNPELQSRIWAFKEQLEAERDTDVVLKAWEIKDIGLQATAKIQASATPLVALMRLSQNFPAHVAGLARMPLPEKLRKHLKQLRRVVREGAEVFSVNNRLVRADHSDLSLFPIMQTLQPFFVGVERLVRVGIPEKVACELLKESRGSKQPSRIDWRHSELLPAYVYHVKNDKKSARWPPSLMSLMYAFPGGLAPVRAALYAMVFVFDPAELSDLSLINGLIGDMPLPVSLHLAMVPGTVSASSSSWDEELLGQRPSWVKDGQSSGDSEKHPSGGTRVSRAIAATYGFFLNLKPGKARNFLKKLDALAKADIASETVTQWPDTDDVFAKIKDIFKEVLNSNESARAGDDAVWDDVVSGKALGADHAKTAARYVYEIGVPVPSFLINGKLLLKSAFDSQQTIFTTIAMEQQNLQRNLAQSGNFQGTPEETVQELLQAAGFLQAYHAAITPEVAQSGGEEGMRMDTSSTAYLLWPVKAFMAMPFLSSSPAVLGEDASVARSSFYHVTLFRDLSQVYLLQSFAAHLLADKSAASSFDSHWTVVIDTSAGKEGAMAEFQSCVHAVLTLKGQSTEAEDVDALMRRKLHLLKFLGAAIPAAMGADTTLSPGRVMELCELGIHKKLDPDLHESAKQEMKTKKGDVETAAAAMLEAANSIVGFPPDAALWVCNGRQIVLESGGQPVFPRHISTLETVESQYDSKTAVADDEEEGGGEESAKEPVETKSLSEWLENLTSLDSRSHGLAAAIRSEALSHGKNERFNPSKDIMQVTPSSFKLHLPPPQPEAASPIKIWGLLDPLSTTAQSASAVLALFGMAFNAEVTLILNPLTRYSEYPLKRYYREVIRWPDYLADGRASADLEGGEVGGGRAEFHLATTHTLTAAVHALPTWLVTAFESRYDMDNLRLADIGDGQKCDVTYALRQLYVEGQAYILSADGWPMGSAKNLQVETYAKGSRLVSADTTVMGNLGYFQVSGNPGLYEVKLKSGLSNDTFTTLGVKDVEVSSYITPPYQLRVRTRPNRSADDLFDKTAIAGGRKRKSQRKKSALSQMFGGLASLFGGDFDDDVDDSPEEEEPQEEEAATTSVVKHSDPDKLPEIHIFSVASGHLYEKLLGIMIMSVRNRTSCPLHFWFIDQFLSPTFKAFIPKMAEQYNFKFDFVTYKWPTWLNPQSEKQRLIWAYKILFLDVLFPVDVPKIIFIDADQVVRSDVRELWDMDLKGNVYGFTPMCDSNTAVEGFRFWKQGYWKNHLRGLPYHISALFVVDLEEFRRTATGDNLRGVYNQLSQDPNSLANLDQDLPNFAQHQIPIFSLPQEWLWCETWCSQESKVQAKTIDLCQNPLTKEPKIVMAKRIIAEWQDYHDEVARFQQVAFASSADVVSAADKAHVLPGGSPGKVEL